MADKIVPLYPASHSSLNAINRPRVINATRDESIASGKLLTQLQTHLDEPAASIHGTLGHIMTCAAEATDVCIDYPMHSTHENVLFASLHSQAQLAAMAFRVVRIPEPTRVGSERICAVSEDLDRYVMENRSQWYMYFAVTLMHMERALEYLKSQGWDITDVSPLRNNALCVELERITGPSHVYRLYMTFRSFLLMK